MEAGRSRDIGKAQPVALLAFVSQADAASDTACVRSKVERHIDAVEGLARVASLRCYRQTGASDRRRMLRRQGRVRGCARRRRWRAVLSTCPSPSAVSGAGGSSRIGGWLPAVASAGEGVARACAPSWGGQHMVHVGCRLRAKAQLYAQGNQPEPRPAGATVGVDKSVVSRWASGVQAPSDHGGAKLRRVPSPLFLVTRSRGRLDGGLIAESPGLARVPYAGSRRVQIASAR
jgi:hypothetical protein